MTNRQNCSGGAPRLPENCVHLNCPFSTFLCRLIHQRGISSYFILIRSFRPTVPLMDLCHPPGALSQAPDWLPPPFLILLTLCHFFFLYKFANLYFFFAHLSQNLYEVAHVCAPAEPMQGGREHAVPSLFATHPQLATRFSAECVCVVSVCVQVFAGSYHKDVVEM